MPLTQSALEDLRLAATKMKLVERRAFFADMCLKYCHWTLDKKGLFADFLREPFRGGKRASSRPLPRLWPH